MADQPPNLVRYDPTRVSQFLVAAAEQEVVVLFQRATFVHDPAAESLRPELIPAAGVVLLWPDAVALRDALAAQIDNHEAKNGPIVKPAKQGTIN